MSLTVLISRLLPDPSLRLPVLETLLSRADVQPAPDGGMNGLLAQLFGLTSTELPVAPLARLADGGAPDAGYWLRADPVNLTADRDRLVMLPLSILDIQMHEAQALAEQIARTYEADGMRLEVTEPSRWYLLLPGNPACHTHDPQGIAGGPVLDYMPDGPGGARLRQLMNEMQMLLHEHPVNQAREAAGLPLINSVWLWGGGRLPDAPTRVPQRVVTDMPLVRGLAMYAGSECLPWPAEPGSLPAAGAELLAFDGGNARALAAIESGFAGPALSQLRRGDLAEITLHYGTRVFRITRSMLRRIWRRRRPLADLVDAA